MTGPAIAPGSVPDTGAFLTRLSKLDPAALVRLRPVGGAGAGDGPAPVELWARLPFEVLVTRRVRAELSGDTTVRAADLLAALAGGPPPVRRDEHWRGALPPPAGPVLESVPAVELRRISTAAAGTLRAAAGRGVGERAVRDAILDHVAITLTTDGSTPDSPAPTAVPTRLLIGLLRMGFLGTDPVRFRTAGDWLGAEATYGTAWYHRPRRPLTLNPVHPA